MKQIDFITQFPKSYTYETYVANHLKSVCAAEGICTNMIYLSEGTFGKYLHKIRKTPPAWVLSFVNLFPGEPPLCDILEVPHFCLPHKGLFEIFSFDPSPSQYIGLSDGKLCRHLHDNGFSHYLPLPPAVDATLRGVQEEEKCFEVVLFEDLIDMDCLKKTWQELFPSHQYQFLEKTLHLCLEQSEKHPFEVLHRVLQEEGSEEDRNRFSDIL